jgi:hypothetical protein
MPLKDLYFSCHRLIEIGSVPGDDNSTHGPFDPRIKGMAALSALPA